MTFALGTFLFIGAIIVGAGLFLAWLEEGGF